MNVVIIGSGNLAHSIAGPLKHAGHRIAQIAGRNKQAVEELAASIGANAATDVKETDPSADVYLIAVSDTAIASVAAQLPRGLRLVVHTSGATSIDVLKGAASRYGVIWPVQTLLKNKPVDFHSVPLCMEGSDEGALQSLKELASSLSGEIHVLNSHQRAIVHLAAAFASNFSNQMYVIAQQILEANKLPFSVLLPSIAFTAEQATNGEPRQNQTGPALRGDKESMQRHLELLTGHPDYQKIYTLVSESIAQLKKNEQGL